ncbi:Hypothetical predicted protein, partial [Marmota monax]
SILTLPQVPCSEKWRTGNATETQGVSALELLPIGLGNPVTITVRMPWDSLLDDKKHGQSTPCLSRRGANYQASESVILCHLASAWPAPSKSYPAKAESNEK